MLFTGKNSQLVVMTLAPGEEIGFETHSVDQFIYVVTGEGRSVIGKDAAKFGKETPSASRRASSTT